MFKVKSKTRILNFFSRIFIGPVTRFVFIRMGLSSRFRVLGTNAAAIGHLCIDVESFLKERITKKYSFRGVLLADRNKVANRVLSKLWAANQGILLIENPFICFILDYLRIYEETSFDCSKYMATFGRPAEIFTAHNEYKDPNPVVSWDSSLFDVAKSTFMKLFPGVEVDRLVVLQARDSSFDNTTQNHNYFSQKYRNSEIGSYSAILKYLKERGYTVIRVGEYEKNELNNEEDYLGLPQVSKFEIELLNVYMSSVCAIFLGSASGPFNLAAIWNRPVFVLNYLPYSILRQHNVEIMAIPKLLALNGRILTAKEIFEKNYHLYRDDALYDEHGLEIVPNDPLDCIEDFKEFFDAFVKRNQRTRDTLINSQQQIQYSEICPKDSFDYNARGLIPRHFFEKHKIV